MVGVLVLSSEVLDDVGPIMAYYQAECHKSSDYRLKAFSATAAPFSLIVAGRVFPKFVHSGMYPFCRVSGSLLLVVFAATNALFTWDLEAFKSNLPSPPNEPCFFLLAYFGGP